MKKTLLLIMAVLVLALLAGCIFPHPDMMNGSGSGNTGGGSSGSSTGGGSGSGGSSGGGNSSGGGSSGGSSGGGSTEWEEVDTGTSGSGSGSSGGSSGSGSGGSSDTAPPPTGVDCSDAATSLIDSYVASNTNGGWWEAMSAEQKGDKFEVGAYVYYRWTDDQGNELENCTEYLFKIMVGDDGECYIGITLKRNSVDTLTETEVKDCSDEDVYSALLDGECGPGEWWNPNDTIVYWHNDEIFVVETSISKQWFSDNGDEYENREHVLFQIKKKDGECYIAKKQVSGVEDRLVTPAE